MDKQEKRRLKKLGKELVEKRSKELQQQLESTNSAPFASDEYVRNEIAIRHKERLLRKYRGVFPGDYIRGNFIVRAIEYDLHEGYPGSPDNYWECRSCGTFLSTLPSLEVTCPCGNLTLTPEEFYVKDESTLLLVRLLGKVDS